MGNAELPSVGANFAPGRTKLRDRHAWNSTMERRDGRRLSPREGLQPSRHVFFRFPHGRSFLRLEQILLVVIGSETYRSVHDRARTSGRTSNTRQFIQQQWPKDEQDHYRKRKPLSHRLRRARAKKSPQDRAGTRCAVADQRRRVKSEACRDSVHIFLRWAAKFHRSVQSVQDCPRIAPWRTSGEFEILGAIMSGHCCARCIQSRSAPPRANPMER